ncbi:hypothetical protein [Streptomyces violascens]|uniref:Helix-turn-helix domain-containing protein n=1 Tax=Streptomyces violascens TaxID=67381 RepID=A0ABQ3QVE1_9ACTN|nr:hypothetical protein [Streptomyces violascens]GGU26423.1 hypothetical protein GCM10010289_54660 [Streptomyces violascens]GHI41203.1 hypothetical protein Sviol_56110 [Streptomyces violascens]
MTILRRRLSTGFTVMPTAALEDSRLSFRARGILAFLIAKPDSWRVRAESIAAAGKEGREAVRTALRELRDAGYYRVVTGRLDDGTIATITEVYDTAQDWAAEEYARQVGRRVKRRLEHEAAKVAAPDASGEMETGDGFSDVGFPDAGSSGLLVSNQSQYSEEKNPPTPTAGAAGEPAPANDGHLDDVAAAAVPGCAAHPDEPGRSCRGCGTTPRQIRAEQQRAEKERFKAAQDAANERVLAEVRRKPGGEELSDVAQRRIAEMRLATVRSAAPTGRGKDAT